ncbi:hypothetical protein XENORESO_015083 [Xenotaenia resolanae]|uniref:Uncharacterized protein n=1 Tax=Xenotaenia resolanae TaxID=208358 RepID=A0ABV0WSR4_9TELE
MPPNSNALRTAHGHTPTGELHSRKADETTHTHSASSTYSPAPSTLAASCPHHTADCEGKAKAPRNATPANTHRRNRADTTEHRTHNRTPNPTPRWDKFIQHEVPAQWQARPRNHTDTPHHCHCNDSPGRNIIQLNQSKCWYPHIQEEDTTPIPHTLQTPHATL